MRKTDDRDVLTACWPRLDALAPKAKRDSITVITFFVIFKSLIFRQTDTKRSKPPREERVEKKITT